MICEKQRINMSTLTLRGVPKLGKKSKSKRNMQESRDAVQPRNGKDRITISKTGDLEK